MESEKMRTEVWFVNTGERGYQGDIEISGRKY